MFLNVLLLLILLLALTVHYLKYKAKTQAEIESLKLTNKLNAEHNKKQEPNGSLSNLAAQNKESNKRMDKLVDAVEALNQQLDKLRDEKNEAIMAYAKIEREMALIQQKNIEAEKNLAEWKKIHEDSLKNTKVIIAQFIGKIYKHLASSGKLNTSDLSHILKKEGVEHYNNTQKPVARMVFKGKKDEVLGAMKSESSEATHESITPQKEEKVEPVKIEQTEDQPKELESIKEIGEITNYEEPEKIETPEIDESSSLKNIAKETQDTSDKKLREELESNEGKVYRNTEESVEQKMDWDGNPIVTEKKQETELEGEISTTESNSHDMDAFLSEQPKVQNGEENSKTREDYLEALNQIGGKIKSLNEDDFEVSSDALSDNKNEDSDWLTQENKG